jgi:hypothetical protein
VGAEEFDLGPGALDQPAEHRVAGGQDRGGAPARGGRPRRRAPHGGAAALTALEPLLGGERLVGHDGRRAAHFEPAGQNALGREAFARRQVSPLDGGADGAGEPRVERAVTARPFANDLQEPESGHRPQSTFP